MKLKGEYADWRRFSNRPLSFAFISCSGARHFVIQCSYYSVWARLSNGLGPSILELTAQAAMIVRMRASNCNPKTYCRIPPLEGLMVKIPNAINSVIIFSFPVHPPIRDEIAQQTPLDELKMVVR